MESLKQVPPIDGRSLLQPVLDTGSKAITFADGKMQG
jgi:hypothetical protein